MMTVPNFCAIPGKDGVFEKWWTTMQAWLLLRGYWLLEIQMENNVWFGIPHEALCIFMGFTNSTKGKKNKDRYLHAVIGKIGGGEDGGKLEVIFDPLQKGSGLETVHSVIFLVPVDPNNMRLVKSDPGFELVPNPEYDKAPYEYDPANQQFFPRDLKGSEANQDQGTKSEINP